MWKSPSEGGVLGDFLAQQGDQPSQQQRAVCGHRQHRLLGDRRLIPQPRLAHAQGILLLAVVDLDLPAVEVDLQQRLGRAD